MPITFDVPQDKFDKMNIDDIDFYHQFPMVLMCLGIPGVTETSIPHIIERNSLNELIKGLTADYLKKFIGMRVNVAFKTNREFLSGLGSNLPPGGKAAENKIYKEIDNAWKQAKQ